MIYGPGAKYSLDEVSRFAKQGGDGGAASGGTGSPAGADTKHKPFDWDQRKKPCEPLDDAAIVRALSKDGDRSALAFKLIRRLQRAGYSPAEIVAVLLNFANLPVMAHYGEPPDEQRVRDDVQRVFAKPDQPGKAPAANEKKLSQRDQLLAIATREVELWQDDAGNAFATFKVDGHTEHHRVQSRRFKSHLTLRFCERHDGAGAPSTTAMVEAINAIGAYAMRGPTKKPFVRVGEHDGKVYLNLGRASWDAVEIDDKGWRIVAVAPIPLLHPSGMLPLPEPVHGGTIDELRPFVNFESEDDFKLVVACLVTYLRPRGPYPIIDLAGQAGATKTTGLRVVQRLIDPNVADVRSVPKSEHDLTIAAKNAHVLPFDNLSHISEEMADMFCRIATGSGFGTRTLYTDEDETLFYACRPVMFNGIPDLVSRGDLADRTISLVLPPMFDDKRKMEEEFWREFDAAHPRILGVLLDGVSRAIAHHGRTKILRPPRMADFARWATAALPAFGWAETEFMSIYRIYLAGIGNKLLESSAVGRVLRAFMTTRESWEGTASDLLAELNAAVDLRAIGDQRQWPADATRLSNQLRRVAPALHQSGIDIQFPSRTNSKRSITIRKTAAFAQAA